MLKLEALHRRMRNLSPKQIHEAKLARAKLEKEQNQLRKNLHKLPAEIRLLILNEYIRLHPPKISERNGRLQHILVNDSFTRLNPKAYHNIFHTTPLKVHKTLRALKSPYKPVAKWPQNRPAFLDLHDQHCRISTQHDISYDVQCTMIVPFTCNHEKIILHPSRIHLDKDEMAKQIEFATLPKDSFPLRRGHLDCSSFCLGNARRAWKILDKELLDKNDICPHQVTKYEVVFVRETWHAEAWRWTMANPLEACLRAVFWMGVCLVWPVIMVGITGYAIPFWAFWGCKWLARSLVPMVGKGMCNFKQQVGKVWQWSCRCVSWFGRKIFQRRK